MTAIVDYGVGNLFSLKSSFAAIGEEICVSSAAEEIKAADRVILPGVGAFEDAARKLRESGLAQTLREIAMEGKPLMGICLGMQLLFERSYEYGVHEGLGLIPGEIKPIAEVIRSGLKIPHMGWNRLDYLNGKSELFKYLGDEEYVYFVHSYYASCPAEYIIAQSEYGHPLTAAVRNRNVYGCQFHPEKSGEKGLKILKAFCEVKVC